MFHVLLLFHSLLTVQALLWGSKTTSPPPTSKGFLGILPKNQTKGVDFCGVSQYYYIIQSDLGCYMRSTDFSKGSDLQIFSLHNSVRGGDHYLAHKDDLFYVIKGNSYRRVKNLNTDEGAVVYKLHENCRNGDHYFSAGGYFYIIFQKKGIYRRVTNMNLDTGGLTNYVIPSGLTGGLYYWGANTFAYYVKPFDKWGLQYHRTTDFNKNTNPTTFSFHADVVSFLPGGLAVNFGKSFGIWQAVSTIINQAPTTITKEYSFTRRIGFVKEKTKSTEHNWQIKLHDQAETGELIKTLIKQQFSLDAQYGGMRVDSTKEIWSDAIEITDKMSFTVPPNSSIYVWQYTLGFGKDNILYSRDAVAFTPNSTPPDVVPFPPAKK